MKNQELYANCEAQQKDFISLWKRLVNIDTGTGYDDGIKKTAAIIVDQLKKLGASVETIPVKKPGAGIHVVGRFTGEGKGSILAMAHMDTVFPVGTAEKRPFRLQDDWAYGPGVSDCKGSIVLFLSAMKQLRKMKYNGFGTITCLFNCDEEMASFDSREVIQKLGTEHDVVLCMESGQVGDGVVMWRKGSSEMKVEVFGRTSHAGSNPENGRNAIMELIHQIQQISNLGDHDKLTTINFTKINAGDRINIIPDYAVSYADVRALYSDELERIEVAVQALAKKTLIPDAVVKVTLQRNNPPFAKNQGTDRLIKIGQDIYEELEKKLVVVGAGGASDANWAAAAGAVVLDGLGPVKGGKNHTEHECTKVSSIVPRMYLLTRMFMELGAGKSLK
jgi:glutamate carboxypeptidase